MNLTLFEGDTLEKSTYIIELKNDGRWSVERIPRDRPGIRTTAVKTATIVRDSEGRFGWDTREEAMEVARKHAGIFPLPDRRGLVEHTRALS